jgi:hypothetical protein
MIASSIIPSETPEVMANAVKFVPQNNCGNAQEPTKEIWYVSPAGFKGLDTVTFPMGARSKMILNVTVD